MNLVDARAELKVPGGPRRVVGVPVTHRATSTWHSLDVLELPARGELEDLSAIDLTIVCDEAWALTDDRRLVAVRGRHEPPFPVGTFVVIRRANKLYRIGVGWASRFVVSRSTSGLSMSVRVQDRTACGLATWGIDRFERTPLPPTLDVTIDVLARLDDCIWVEPYPRGARGVVCLTDHPDFDTSPKVEALSTLFARTGIRITKGVFPRSQPSGTKNEPGLDHGDYLSSVQLLHTSGSEIAFHGFGPRIDAPSIDECRRRSDAMLPFGPRTWIDHGTGRYLFSRQNRLDEGVPLREFLAPYGIDSYWSYLDLWDNPVADLSCWTQRSGHQVFGELTRSMARLHAQPPAQNRQKALLYPFLHGLKNILGVHATNALRTQRPSLTTLHSIRTTRRSLVDARSAPFVIYGNDGAGYALNPGNDWVFDTVLLNHPAIQLSGELIEHLAARSGLLIAHVYLCAQHPYLRGGCFDSTSDRRLSPTFVDAIEQLASVQRNGSVISITMAGLRDTLAAHHATELERTAAGWTIRRPSHVHELAVTGPTIRTTSFAPHVVVPLEATPLARSEPG